MMHSSRVEGATSDVFMSNVTVYELSTLADVGPLL